MDRPNRLTTDEIDRQLVQFSRELRSLVLAMRQVVLATAPEVCEAIKFNALCYFNPTHAYGAIGGNVCMIEFRKGRVKLSFIQGANLPDPEGLLQGSGRAKRYVEIHRLRDTRRTSIRALIRAAIAFAAADEM